jgi:cell fate (sporulation/competence/biofilm development) regulator YlbF (YheA/YmcA/DUF963 family)
MDDKVFDDIEIAPPSAVKRAARDFAAEMAETPEFKAFEQAADRFRQDQNAPRALRAHQEKQIFWRVLMQLNALSPEQHAELENLQSAFMNEAVVQEYFKAQTDRATICQALGDTLSESIGLNYAAACGVSCCG